MFICMNEIEFSIGVLLVRVCGSVFLGVYKLFK